MQIRNSTLGYIVVIVLLSVSSFFSLNLYFRQRSAHDSVDIRDFPYTVGNWQGKDLEITEREYEILETRNLISREYINSSGERLTLFIIYSETNRAVFHPPEVCLIGSGVKMVDKKTEKIDSGEYKFSANKLYTEKGDYRAIALYCYKAGGLYTDNFYLQQISFALNQLLGRHKGGATIRVSMPIREEIGVTRSYPNTLAGTSGHRPGLQVTSEKKVLDTLKTFIAEAVKIIDSLS